MLNLDKYNDKVYDDGNYNCLHFASDVYCDITERDFRLYIDDLLCGKNHRTINPSKLKEFTQIDTPIDPCLAIMRGAEVHAGIYHSGKIIHLTRNGIHAQPPHIAGLQHGRISYYAIKNHVDCCEQRA